MALERFITVGIDDATQRAAIGDLPRGHGVLGVLIARPAGRSGWRTSVTHPRSYGFPDTIHRWDASLASRW